MKSVLVVLLAGLVPSLAYNNGMGATPPMGWNTWCTDDLCGLLDRCTEKEVKSVADALVSSGMKDLGYEYILLDDCWAAKDRDENGELQPQADQFPSGMPALVDYVHSLGLKFGLYTCVGTYTCKKKRPGSYGNFDVDSQTFAKWEIDYVKADNCYRPKNVSESDLYTEFSRELNATGHPMLFATCEWGEDEVWEWGYDIAQMFRVQADHLPLWQFPLESAGVGYGQGVKDIIEWMAYLQPSKYVRPYGWMDPDFLMTLFLENYTVDSWTPMTYTESRTEFSFWSLWSAPLIMSTDPRNMSDEKKSIVLNEEVIAIDQDPAFIGGDRIKNTTDGGQVWSKPLSNGDIAVILYNPGNDESIDIEVTWEDLGWLNNATIAIRDLWAHDDIEPSTSTSHSTMVDPRDVSMLRLTKLD